MCRPRRDAGVAARSTSSSGGASTGVVEGPQGEARKGDASGGRPRREWWGFQRIVATLAREGLAARFLSPPPSPHHSERELFYFLWVFACIFPLDSRNIFARQALR